MPTNPLVSCARRAAASLGLLLVAASFPSQSGAQAVTREEVAHVLRRITFGPTPRALNLLTTKPLLDAYIAAQLNAPTSGYSVSSQPLMNLLPAEPIVSLTGHGWTEELLQVKQVALSLACDYQLRELMTYVWEQHFSTQLKKSEAILGSAEKAVRHEWHENQGFRERALGTFLELLTWSMNSAAMRIYLDSVVNCSHPSRAFNENYPREFCELHTLGTDMNGAINYTNDGDIPEVTRILSGMAVNTTTGAPFWIPLCHDYGSKSAFTTTPVPDFIYTPSGTTANDAEIEVDLFRRHIVASPQCKDFICKKLIRFFVGDHAPVDTTLLTNCVNVWGTDGDIRAVLAQIFASPVFRTPNPQWTRTELPIEATISQARILNASLANPSSATQLRDRLQAILGTLDSTGARPFTFPSPDGFPFESQRQVGTSVYWKFGEYAYRVYADAAGTGNASQNLVYDPTTALQSEVTRRGLNWNNAAHVALASIELLFHSRYTAADLAGAQFFLNSDSTTGSTTSPTSPWTAAGADADARVRLLVAYLCTIPQAFEK